MIFQSRLTTTTATIVYYSTDNGLANGNNQDNAVTCIALCNTGASDPINENTNVAVVDVYLNGAAVGNQVVSQLIIPAGETVFLSEERLVLSNQNGAPDNIQIRSSVGNLITITLSVLRV